MSKKRLFQVFDEMNVNDETNKTAHLGCCYDIIEAKTAKGGGHVTMGVPAEEITKIFLGDRQPILLLLDKKESHRLNDQPVQLQTSEQLQKQIEQEADEITAKLKDNNDYQAGYSKGYEDGFIDAGGKYGIKWTAAEQRAERYEKALKDFADRLSEVCGQNGIITAGIHFIIDDMKMFDITPKISTDE